MHNSPSSIPPDIHGQLAFAVIIATNELLQDQTNLASLVVWNRYLECSFEQPSRHSHIYTVLSHNINAACPKITLLMTIEQSSSIGILHLVKAKVQKNNNTNQIIINYYPINPS